MNYEKISIVLVVYCKHVIGKFTKPNSDNQNTRFFKGTITTRVSDFAKIKNNLRTPEPQISRKIRTLSFGNSKLRTKI